MKTNDRPIRVPTRFGRETRFRLKPRLIPPNRPAEVEFRDLKSRLLSPVLDEVADPGTRRQLRLAANEAAAIAWTTPFPLLVFPELLEEKAAEVRDYTLRQTEILDASPVVEVVEA